MWQVNLRLWGFLSGGGWTQSLDACHLPEMTRDGEIESVGFLIQKEGKLHPGNMTPSKVRAGRMFNCKPFLRPSC